MIHGDGTSVTITATPADKTTSKPPDDSSLAGSADRLIVAIARDSWCSLAVLGCASVAGAATAVLLPAAHRDRVGYWTRTG
jgi:hypothetical protein